MCGIVGSIGLKTPRDYIMKGLKILDYRGYDSAGVAFLNNGLQIYKDVGTVEHLDSIVPNDITTNVMIGHTRWATHGVPSKENTHPHVSYHKKICLVHNGVVENFEEIKSFLLSWGYEFYSQTDSEVVANLLEHFYISNNDIVSAIKEVMHMVKGSYAICFFLCDRDDQMYIFKHTSPLVVGIGENFSLVASDASPMINLTTKFIELADNEYGVVTPTDVNVYNTKGQKVKKEYIYKDVEAISHDLKGYPHYMLKEIEEIEPVVNKLIGTYFRDEQYQFDPKLLKALRSSDHIMFIACGTSYHSSLVGGRYFEDVGISTTKYIASEWAFHPTTPGRKPFIILISQSGETADLIHCLRIIKKKKIKSLIITNTGGSTLDRGCDFSCLLHAGIEVSVASTKAYVAQVTLLALLAGALSKNEIVVQDIRHCLDVVKNIRENYKDKIKAIAEEIKDKSNLFYLGRSFDYYLSLEASLKLKEISYIHSEAIPGGELKHGPIALIEKGTPTLVFITDPETAASMRGNIEEVKSRGARVYVASTENLSKPGDAIVVKNYAYYLSSIAISSIAFYLAYYVSLAKGLNVDKPRNLAKSVTVE